MIKARFAYERGAKGPSWNPLDPDIHNEDMFLLDRLLRPKRGGVSTMVITTGPDLPPPADGPAVADIAAASWMWPRRLPTR